MKSYHREYSFAGIGLLAALCDRTLAQEERAIVNDLLEKIPESDRQLLLKDSLQGNINMQHDVLSLNESDRKKLLSVVVRILEADGKLTKSEMWFLHQLLNAVAFARVVDKYGDTAAAG